MRRSAAAARKSLIFLVRRFAAAVAAVPPQVIDFPSAAVAGVCPPIPPIAAAPRLRRGCSGRGSIFLAEQTVVSAPTT